MDVSWIVYAAVFGGLLIVACDPVRYLQRLGQSVAMARHRGDRARTGGATPPTGANILPFERRRPQ